MVKVKTIRIRDSIKKKKRFLKSKGKQVVNAIPNLYKNIKFASGLETAMFKKLEEHKFIYQKDFFYEPPACTLLEGAKYPLEIWIHQKNKNIFTLESHTIRRTSYTPDFSDNLDLTKATWIIECKGRPNERWAMVYKLFKHWLIKNNPTCKVYIPSNVKECLETVNKILYERK
jgi:hypothetical protein